MRITTMKKLLEIWQIEPSKSIVILAAKLIQAMIPTLQIVTIGKILDLAIQRTFRYDLFLLLMFCVTYSILCDSVMKVLWISLQSAIEKANEEKMIQTLIHTRYEYLEQEEMQDRVQRVQKKSSESMIGYFESVLMLISMILRITGVFVILLQFSVTGAVCIIVTFIPVIWFSIQSGKNQYEIDHDNANLERYADYLEQILNSRECVNERCLFGYFDLICKKWDDVYRQRIRNKIKGIKRWYVKSKAASLLAALAILTVLGIMLKGVVLSGQNIGLYISVASSLLSLIYMIATEFSRSLDKLAETFSVLKERRETFELLEQNQMQITGRNDFVSWNEEIEEIEFKNVSFKYPGTNENVLNNLSFHVKKGESIAFVGENGAGKTTIVKLLTGLYQHFDGEILWNGKTIHNQENFPYEKIFSVVSQNFVKYPLTIKENIVIGNLDKKADTLAVQAALRAVGLEDRIHKMEAKTDTVLGKLFEGGVDLSGGEWQRLTIGRMIFADKAVQILDEPTAAMDPIAEAEIYNQFRELMKKDKITIMISHRLGSVKNASKIFVLKKGHIIEQGNHEELMAKDGYYAEMYQSQSGWYL